MSIRNIIKKTVCMAAVFAAGMVVSTGVRAAGDVIINSTNFPDENFRSYVSTTFDTDKNGTLSSAEIDAVTSINVRGRGIENMTGLANFTALKSLNCSSNNISSISLTSNTALNYLNVSGNKLTSLSVSKNTVLRTLICDGNSIDVLDLKNNSDISYVDASGNELSSIDITNCPAISILSISDNQLVAVNLKSNTALTSLAADNNQISSIDLSANKKLANVNVSYNNLVSLDVGSNTLLSSLECSNNRLLSLKLADSIETLACGYNELTVLDVKALAGLHTLDASNNGIYNIDISSNKALTSINVSHNKLAMLDASQNTLLKSDKVIINGNSRDVYVNTAGEIIVNEAGIDVDRIAAITTAGVATGQALTAEVTGTALVVTNKTSLPTGIDYSYDMGNGLKADFRIIPTANKKLVPATKTISVYVVDDKTEYPLYVTPIGGNTSVSWSSSNNSVATVDSEGRLKALSPGATTVTASAAGYDSAVYTVNVYRQPSNINISPIEAQYYTGSAVTPVPVVKDGDMLLVQNTDYILSYENNIQAGYATINIKGCGRYSFTLVRKFRICYNIAGLVSSAIPDQLFTGNEVMPDVTIMNGTYKLINGKDYTLTYMNNIAIGTGIVTITGRDKYAGVKIQSFNIMVPQVTNLVKSGNVKTKITLTWDKIDGVTGYRVYKYNPTTKKYAYLKQVAGSANNTYTDTGLTAGTNYRYRVRAYVTVNNVKNYGKYSTKLKTYTKFKATTLTAKAGTKKATLTWKKINGVTGYRVYMKTGTGKFTKIKELKGAGKIKYTKTGLTKKKTYYFRVRAFKTVNGQNIYGAYSTIKTVKAK